MIAARNPSNIIPCRPAHLLYLCECMREEEREQYVALTCAEQYDPDVAARGFINTAANGFAITALCQDNTPAVAGGYEEILPGVWQSWMVGTERGWAEQWRSITKGSRWLADRLFQLGARRVQTVTLATRTQAIEWFERGLGLKPEGIWRGYGRDGQDVAAFSRVRGE